MISARKDLFFVSQDAVKNIAIVGAQYPVRNQKLVLLGEDAAVLKEAILERRFYQARTGLKDEFRLPQGHVIPSGSSQAGSDALQSVVQYDTRILDVREDVDAEYEDVKSALKGKVWIDRTKAEKIGNPQSNPVIQCYGDNNPTAYIEATRDYDDIMSDYAADVNSLVESHNAKLAKLKTDYDTAVAEENKRFEDSKPYDEAEAKYEEAVAQARTDYDRAVEDEDERHEKAEANIAQKLEDDKITADEAKRLYAEEAERHGFALEVANNDMADAITAAETAMKVEITEAEDEHYKNLKDIGDDYDGKVKDENDDYERESTQLMDARDAEVAQVANGIPGMASYLYSDNTSKAWRERDESFAAALIVKSCADEFYSRYALYRPASDAIIRVYADLERMNDIFGTTLNCPGGLWRDANTFTYGGVEYDPELAAPISSSGDSMILGSDDGGVGEYSNYDFFVYYGQRREIDHIDAIYADVVMHRHDKVSRQSDRNARIAQGQAEAAEIMQGVDRDRWRFEESTIQGMTYVVVVLINTQGMTPAQIADAELRVRAANDVLDEACREAAEMYDQVNYAYSIARLKFEMVGIENKSDLDSLDALSDDLERGRKALAETRDENLRQSLLTYEADIARAQKSYDDAIKAAKKALDDAKEAANATYVQTLWGIAPEYNARLAKATTAAERNAILAEFTVPEAQAQSIKDEAERQANAAYYTAKVNADAQLDTAERTAGSNQRTRDAATEAEYNAADIRLRESLSESAQRIYDAHYAIRTAAGEAKTRADQAAWNERENTESQALSEADQSMRSRYGAPSWQSYSGWWWGDGHGGTPAIEVGQGAGHEKREYAEELNSQVSSAYYGAQQIYNETIRGNKVSYWNAMKNWSEIRPSARGKFMVTDVRPVDSSPLSGDHLTQLVNVIAMRNVEVVYKPWTATGADFSQYYEELG